MSEELKGLSKEMSSGRNSRTRSSTIRTSLMSLSVSSSNARRKRKRKTPQRSRLAKHRNKWPICKFTSHQHLSCSSTMTRPFSTTSTRSTRLTWHQVMRRMLRQRFHRLRRPSPAMFLTSVMTVTRKTFQLYNKQRMSTLLLHPVHKHKHLQI